MPTSRFIKFFQTAQLAPIIGANIWVKAQEDTDEYPTGYLLLQAHPSRPGVYYRDGLTVGEYKIYMDTAGGTSPELYEEHIWVGENELTGIADRFDENIRLVSDGIKDEAVTAAKLQAALYNNLCKTDQWSGIPAAYILDGTDDSLSVPGNPATNPPAAAINFGTGDFSVELLMNVRTLPSSGARFIGKYQGSTQPSWQLILENDGKDYFGLHNGTAGTTTYTSRLLLGTGLKHLIYVIDRANSIVYRYLNGALTATIPISFSGSVSNDGANFDIRAIGFQWNAAIVRTYNHTLSAAEVLQCWNNGAPHLYRVEWVDRNADNTNLCTNGSFESDADSALPASWVQVGNHTIIAATDATAPVGGKVAEISGGIFSLGGNYVYGVGNAVIGKRYRLTFFAKSISGSTTIRLPYLATGSSETQLVITTSWAQYTVEGIATATQQRFGTLAAGVFRIDNYSFTPIGCTAELLPENSGANGGIETMNGLHWSTSGNPVAPQALRDYRSVVSTTPVALTNTQKAQTILTRVILKNNNENTQTCSLGTSSGGTQLINAQSVAGGSEVVVSVNSYSATERTLYAVASAVSFSITLIYERVAL